MLQQRLIRPVDVFPNLLLSSFGVQTGPECSEVIFCIPWFQWVLNWVILAVIASRESSHSPLTSHIDESFSLRELAFHFYRSFSVTVVRGNPSRWAEEVHHVVACLLTYGSIIAVLSFQLLSSQVLFIFKKTIVLALWRRMSEASEVSHVHKAFQTGNNKWNALLG